MALKYKLKKAIQQGNHIIVFGLNKNNSVYIDSELNSKPSHNIIVVEKDANNLFIESYKQKGVSIIIGDIDNPNVLYSINLQKSKHILISTGNDMANLEVGTQLLNIDKNLKVYIHLEDKNLRHFHKENGILYGKNIKVFSYYEDASRALFESYDIDGESTDLIVSNMAYSVAIVGNTNLAYEVIAQACIMGQLPNENKLTIYCIDKNPNEFKQSVYLRYTEIEHVPNVELKYIELDCNSKEFYTIMA